MEKIHFYNEKISKLNFNYLPLGPRSNSYSDKLVFYCGAGLVISALVSFGFKTNIKSTIVLGLGIPMGYLHKDLLRLVYDPSNDSAIDALPSKTEESTTELKN